MTAATLLAFLELGTFAVSRLPSAVRAVNDTRRELEKMMKEGKDPSPDDIKRMLARMRFLTTRLESDEVTGSE